MRRRKMNEESRIELKKYYKFVLMCTLCKQEYGCDKQTETDKRKGICPECGFQLTKSPYTIENKQKKRIALDALKIAVDKLEGI